MLKNNAGLAEVAGTGEQRQWPKIVRSRWMQVMSYHAFQVPVCVLLWRFAPEPDRGQ